MYQEILEEIFNEESGHRRTLPRLKEEESSFTFIADLLEELAEFIRLTLNNLFGKAVSGETISIILTILVVALLLTICGIFLHSLYSHYSQTWSLPKEKSKPVFTHPLQHALQKALEDQNYLLALRIAWRLTLRTKRLNESLTPNQFQKLSGPSETPSSTTKAIVPHIPELYRAMFDDGKNAEELIQILGQRKI